MATSVHVSLGTYFETFDRIDEERRRLHNDRMKRRTALQNCLGAIKQVQSDGFARMTKCRQAYTTVTQ